MYLILAINTWVLSYSYIGAAPDWLAIDAPVALTLVCAIRIFQWRQATGEAATPARATLLLRRTNRLSGVIAAVFSGWALALCPYGDLLAQSHVAFYMAITVIGCIFCLMHLRSAALIVAIVVNVLFMVFFASSGNSTFVAMTVNAVLVVGTLFVILQIQYRVFTDMIAARTRAETLLGEKRLKEAEEYRLLRMIDNMPVAVMTVDPASFKITYINETSRRTLGQIEHLLPVKVDQLVGTCIDVFHRDPEYQRSLLANPENLPHRARITLGPEVIEITSAAVHGTDGAYIGPMLTWEVVTQQAAAEQRIRQLALFDPLTGLANRTNFRDSLEERLVRSDAALALLFIDLDGFKLVNDTNGHLVGDALLGKVADRLRLACSGPDRMVGRLGGDEFGVILDDCDVERASAVAGALIEALRVPYNIGQLRNLRIGASIGIVTAPTHGEDVEDLLARADMALYAAKAAGRGKYSVFLPKIEADIQERVRLEAELHVALDQQEGLFVFYQPIVELPTRRVTAREALLRWYNPRRGWVSPAEFIPAAEESGLIERIGPLVLDRACREAVSWVDGCRVAVNVSVAQLGNGTLTPAVRGALKRSGLAPSRLELEITESALLRNEPDGLSELHALREMGVRVALDDFGTGYSSLAHIRAFPFDKIKIDGSFVRDALTRPDCAAVIGMVADVGRRLGVATVAESVETEAHLALVMAEGCTEAQGYLFGRPAPCAADAPHVAAIERSLERAGT
jgi:diguanylate cyclase (GGDEF)-like protein